jgi:hypothetical protein
MNEETRHEQFEGDPPRDYIPPAYPAMNSPPTDRALRRHSGTP